MTATAGPTATVFNQTLSGIGIYPARENLRPADGKGCDVDEIHNLLERASLLLVKT